MDCITTNHTEVGKVHAIGLERSKTDKNSISFVEFENVFRIFDCPFYDNTR